jgi:hypothetical protein
MRYRRAVQTAADPLRTSGRFDRLDALRGTAMLWMAAFHFCYDLDHFGIIHERFRSDPFWTWQRVAIVSLGCRRPRRCTPVRAGRASGAAGPSWRAAPCWSASARR